VLGRWSVRIGNLLIQVMDLVLSSVVPSGMLCRAMAMANTAPIAGSCKAATNVARPSGKLCRAIANAVWNPIRCNL
jgi:hypothetical protein